MGYYSTCACYEDIIGNLRLNEGSIYMTLTLPAHDENIQVTLNAMQAKQLGDMLALAAGSIQLAKVNNGLLGDIQLNIEDENTLKGDNSHERNGKNNLTDCNGRYSDYPASRRETEAIPAA